MSTKSKNSTSSGKSSNESNAEQEKFSKTSNSNMNSPVTPNNEEYLARLCHLKKWPHFQGYGFNLHAERSKMGQHIGKVDTESPADLAGLKEGDRIIEVNNVNISNENHQQVVKRIRNGLEVAGVEYPDQVILLVVDSKADEYYKKINVVPKNDMENIIRLVTPDRQPSKSNENDSENNEINSEAQKKENASKHLKNQSSNFPIPSHKDEHIEKDRKNSNSSSVSDNAESKVKTSKTSQELNNSISSNSNTSNNASISKEHISINSDDRKSTSNEMQKEKRSNNMSHKDKSSSDSFGLTNLETSSQNKTNMKIIPQSSLSSSRSENNRPINYNFANKPQIDNKNDANDPYNFEYNTNEIEFKAKALGTIQKILEINKKKSTDKVEDFNILNNYFDICHQYETISNINESRLMNKKKLVSRLDSDPFQSRMNQADLKLLNSSISKSNFLLTTECHEYKVNETHAVKKPPRPPPPTILDNLCFKDLENNSLTFPTHSSSPVCIHQSFSLSPTSSPPNLIYLCHQNKNQTQFSYQNKNSIMKEAKYLDMCLEMSAADYRNFLKSKGRSDPRLVQVDMKQKYEIFQNM